MHGRDCADDGISTMRFGISTVLRPDWLVFRTNSMHPDNIMAGLSYHILTFVRVLRVGANGHPAARVLSFDRSAWAESVLGATNSETCFSVGLSGVLFLPR